VDTDPVVLGDELMNIISGLRRRVRRAIRPTEPASLALRGAHLELMRLIAEQPGITVSAAAKAMHLAPNSVSTLVKQLADIGIVDRQYIENDRRVVQLELTVSGVDWLRSTRAARLKFIGKGFAGLTDADRVAIANALPALQSLLSNLDRGSDD
jgi:DNA-binding MarR family transcriptional regulator